MTADTIISDCYNAHMEARDLFRRAELLNLDQLRQDRPDWSDRLPTLHRRPMPASKDLVRWHWSYLVPVSFREGYDLWRMQRRHRRNLEQIEIEELNEVCEQAMIDDSSAKIGPIYEKHALRRVQSRFLVATEGAPAARTPCRTLGPGLPKADRSRRSQRAGHYERASRHPQRTLDIRGAHRAHTDPRAQSAYRPSPKFQP